MTEEEFTAYLAERFDGKLRWYSGKALAMKRRHAVAQTTVIVGGALSPVAVALTESTDHGISILWPIVISALVAIAAGLQAAFKYQELWVRYRAAAEAMSRARARFDARLGQFAEGDEPVRRRALAEYAERLMEAENDAWIETLAPERRDERRDG